MRHALFCVLISLLFLPSVVTAGEDEKPLRNFQISILPFIGTDGSESVDYRYERSFNLFGGITGGIERYELGGFLNITVGRVNGLQLAGFGNIVSDNIYGFQGAGFINAVGASISGARGAGFINVNGGSFNGAQGAGFMNISGGSVQAFSGAGFANIAGGSYTGFAGAGFANLAGGDFQGLAGAGFANITGGDHMGAAGAGFGNISGGSVNGVYGAGFGNIAGGNMTGIQLAGFMNISGDMQGLQAAGFLNVTGELSGLQIGLINFADTVAAGTPIGFLSIVRRGGLRQVELAVSDVSHTMAAFRIGTPSFYNIFTFAARPFKSQHYQAFGYGIGSRFTLTDQLFLYPEIHTTQLQQDFLTWDRDEIDLLNELRINMSYQTGKRIELFAGPVIYNQLFRTDEETGFTGKDIAPGRVWYEDTWGTMQTKFWVGLRAGIYIRAGTWQ